MNVSYDEAFDTRVSADLKVRFGGASTTAQRKEVQQLPVINALTSTPSNRDVRVHDCECGDQNPGDIYIGDEEDPDEGDPGEEDSGEEDPDER